MPRRLACSLLLALLPTAAGAQDGGDPAYITPAYITLGAGAFNVTDAGPNSDAAADVRLEYRHGEGLAWLKPWAGVELTGDGGVWGGGGVALDVTIARRVVVTLGTGVGAYGEGSGKDLGSVVQFRSQLELGYRFADASRLTAAFGHLSNAGLGDSNPGAETATVYYHLPLSNLAGLLR